MTVDAPPAVQISVAVAAFNVTGAGALLKNDTVATIFAPDDA